MKKLLSLMIVAVAVVALTACGGDEETSAPDAEETSAEVVDVNVEAGDKEFTIVATNFDYVSDEELVVKKGDKVTLHIENEEGVHGLDIPSFGIQGGAGETVEFEATEAGTHEILCSIPCGAGHNDMKINLVVVD
ncbi:hypothetical protein BKP35_10305 [Anaerobacillus arseniciselenatis]|uniref:Cytochrome oxidase subunit II copper A binding domain-containing protein n=1 Tax=Anaerobacillus arseniciselenatis TaxID=85682 RepID=A0A1S2LMP1_9BACI|nr:hypothetical protein [Anaerobacillus arseniciselenatis]OIJ12947.1 hypothetical protein BKP35_10305 [Anaerobacillus arseniciselenatis]